MIGSSTSVVWWFALLCLAIGAVAGCAANEPAAPPARPEDATVVVDSAEQLATALDRASAAQEPVALAFSDFGPTLTVDAPLGARVVPDKTGVRIEGGGGFALRIEAGTTQQVLWIQSLPAGAVPLVVDNVSYAADPDGDRFSRQVTLGYQDFFVAPTTTSKVSRRRCLSMAATAASLRLSRAMPPNPIHALEVLGGKVKRDDTGQLVELDLSDTHASDTTLKLLPRFTQLRVLALRGTAISDAGLASVAKLGNLRRLNLDDTKVTDAGIARLAPLPSLTQMSLRGTAKPVKVRGPGFSAFPLTSKLNYLDLSHTLVDDAGVTNLATLRSLQVLLLDQTLVNGAGLAALKPLVELTDLSLAGGFASDDGLKGLAPLGQLESLDLSNTELTGAGLAHAENGQLQRLNLQHTKLTAEGLKSVARLRHLTHVLLDQSTIDDAGLASFADLPELRSLSLNKTQVGDAGLAHLANLTKLEHLWAPQTQVTDRGIDHLVGVASLRVLNLAHSSLTDESVEKLAQLKQVTALYLMGTELSDDAIARIRKALPATASVRK